MNGTKYGTYPETSSLLGFNLISTSCTGLPARILPSAGLDDSTNSRVAMWSSRWAWKQGADGLCYEDGYLHVPSDGPVSSSCAGGVHQPVCLELSAQRPQQANKLMKLWCSSGAQWGLTWTSLPLVGPSAHGSEANISDASTDSLEYRDYLPSRVCSEVQLESIRSSPIVNLHGQRGIL